MTPEPADRREAWTGSFLSVDEEDWEGLGRHEIVRMGDAAAVVPILPDGDVLLVRQLRPAVREALLEIPAGMLDVEGEDALTCAGRELVEETGFRHRSMEFLGGVYVAPGTTAHYVHLFRALVEPAPVAEPEPGIEVLREPMARMVAAARAGRVRDAKTALGLLLADARPSVA